MSIHLKADLLGLSPQYSGDSPFYVRGELRKGKTVGKSTSGIGMTEVIAMMGAIEALHDCRVALTVTTRGQGHNGSGRIVLEATFDTLPGSDLPKVVGVEHKWPTNAAATVTGLFYNLCWQLDYAIQQAYEQMTLPK